MRNLIESYPWQCPVCRHWPDHDYQWHGGCWRCNDTGIRWSWLRRLRAWWRGFAWYSLRPVRCWLFSRCLDCGWPERLLGVWLPGHKKCLPF
jgi:hypothetical protein